MLYQAVGRSQRNWW